MFEVSLIAWLVATATCFLKGLHRSGLVSAVLGVALGASIISRGDASAGDISTGTRLILDIGLPVLAIAAIVLAARAAAPGSFWHRKTATNRAGELLLNAESAPSRTFRAAAGVLCGAAPGALFLAIVAATADTGDEMQLGFLAIPLVLVGALYGAWAGYHWLPASRVEPGPSSVDTARPAHKV
jgi:hypothetical protein